MVKPESIPELLPEMDELNAEQQEKITQFLEEARKLYHASLPPLLAREKTEERQRLLAYKFLKARKWKMKDAATMFTSTVDFRAKEKLDEMRVFPSAFPLLGFDEGAIQDFLRQNGEEHVCDREGNDKYDACAAALQKSYVNLYHYTDKAGHPVLYDCCGQCDVNEILKDLEALTPKGKSMVDVVIPYHIYMNEVQHHLIRYADHLSQSEGGRPITGITVVMNAKSFGLGMIQRRTVQLVRSFLNVDQKYYPEVLHRLFVINCPSVVQAAFNMVKRSLDENTRNKIVFCGKNESLPVLQQVIDHDKIPVELGGGCRCPGGCLPRRDGAWPPPTPSSQASSSKTTSPSPFTNLSPSWSHGSPDRSPHAPTAQPSPSTTTTANAMSSSTTSCIPSSEMLTPASKPISPVVK